MKLIVKDTSDEMGALAAAQAAAVVNDAIEKRGNARILLSTGTSQFPFFKYFVKEKIDWSKVEMFHLDEYVGISKDHFASFNKYLTERFVSVVKPGKAHLIDGERDVNETIAELTGLLSESPVDLGMIGIGENAHIAFNDPPADFEDESAYKVVTLAKTCLQQQIHEGWFKTEEEAFKQAISMTCRQIMKCRTIISVVPYKCKADAVYKTMTGELSNLVPATLLKTHADYTLYCDADSASRL